MWMLKVVRERAPEYGPLRVLRGPTDIFVAFKDQARASDREVFHILALDARHRVIGVNQVSVGTVNTALVHPREVFKVAILQNAAAIAMVHNHPSGDPTPSHEDLSLTERMRQAGDLLGIKVLDHVVIGDEGFVSMAEQGSWYKD